MSAAANSTCRPASRRCCAARPASSSKAARTLLKRLATVKPKLADTKFDFAETQRLRPGDLPLGQHHPPARAGRRALRPHQSRHSLCRVRRAGRHGEGHREILPADDRRAGRGRERRRHHRQGHASARTSICCSARPTSRCPTTTSITCRSTSSNFSGPHKRLGERGLVNREDNQYQYRFRDITDLDTGKHLFTIEHEVRSLTHPMFFRPLVNRNPAQTARNYSNGYDQNSWAMEPQHFDDQRSAAQRRCSDSRARAICRAITPAHRPQA